MDFFDWERLSPSHWFADLTEPIDHPAYIALAVLLTLSLVAAIYVRLMSDTMFGGHRFKQRQAVRLANYTIWLTTIGLVILLFRWQPVPVLSKRLWFYLWWLALIGTVAYFTYFYRRRYPDLLIEYEEQARRRRYLPRAPGSAGRGRRRATRRR